MKKYYLLDGKRKLGPFSFEELKIQKINPETLIWYEELDDWTKAKYIKELKEILELSPPPLDFGEKTNSYEEKISAYEERTNSYNESDINDNVEENNAIEQEESSNVFSFKGRIGRAEYAFSFILTVFLLTILDRNIDLEVYPFLILLYFPIYWFIIAQGAKRCHDLGYSGWWQLIPFYPMVLLFMKGQEGNNKYGKNPIERE